MRKAPIIQELEKEFIKKDVPAFNVGDTVVVNTKIIEGSKERGQTFTGTVVAKKGYGLSETFTVYRTAYGSSMDRIFLLHSPRISSIEVVRAGKVRRAKLNYIRGKSGKSAKIKEKYVAQKKSNSVEEEVSKPEVSKEKPSDA